MSEKIKDMKANILRLLSENTELKRERDEAREQNAKLSDIAERAIGGLEFKYKLHCGADIQLGIRAELKQLKEGAK